MEGVLDTEGGSLFSKGSGSSDCIVHHDPVTGGVQLALSSSEEKFNLCPLAENPKQRGNFFLG